MTRTQARREAVKEEIGGRMPSPKTVITMARRQQGEINGYAAIMPVNGRFLVCEITMHDSRPVIVEMLGEYDLYILSEDDRRRRRYVVSIGEGKLGCWSGDELAAARNKIPGLVNWLCEWMLECQSSALNRIADYAYGQLDQKVALTIVRMIDRFGAVSQDGSQASMDHVTHEMVGWYIGTSREITTQKINQLQRKHLISWKRSKSGITIDVKRWNHVMREELHIYA